MLPRTLEPEVMDTAEDAAEYDAMDHSAVNRLFASDLLTAWEPTGERSRMLDVGTGTAQIPIELVRQFREQRPSRTLHITAIDLAEEMLRLGQTNVERAGAGDAIELRLHDAKQPWPAGERFDVVISNSIVHHIPEPRPTLAMMANVLHIGGLLFVRDLSRPDSREEVDRLVELYAGEETERARTLFRESLHAALTPEEVRERLSDLPVNDVRVQLTSDRHWTLTAVRCA